MTYGQRAQKCDCLGGYCFRQHCPDSPKARKRRREAQQDEDVRREPDTKEEA
jgi:hypothetical protein